MGRLIHADASGWTVAVVRVWIFGMCLGDVVREPVSDLVGLPLEYVTAVGPLALLPDAARRLLYTEPALQGLKIVVAALLVACVVGARPFRPIALTTCVLLAVLHALLRSVGHVNHGELPMVYGMWLLALFPAAPPATMMAVLTLVFCLTYAFTGAYRLAISTPGIFVDGSVMRLIVEPVLKPGVLAAPRGVELLASPLAPTVLSAGFVWVTIVELLSPLALVLPWFRRLWIGSMLVFHAFAWGVMQIPFVHNLVLMPLLMLDWERWWRPPAR